MLWFLQDSEGNMLMHVLLTGWIQPLLFIDRFVRKANRITMRIEQSEDILHIIIWLATLYTEAHQLDEQPQKEPDMPYLHPLFSAHF